MTKNSPATLKKKYERQSYWKAHTPVGTFPPTLVRVCKDCRKTKECGWNYSFTQTGRPEYRTRCRDCHNKYSATRQRMRRPKATAYSKKYKRERKAKCVEYLGGTCIKCGYSHVAGLTFHHRDRTTKKHEIGAILDWKWETILAELDKCNLVCWNCHMEIHAEERA